MGDQRGRPYKQESGQLQEVIPIDQTPTVKRWLLANGLIARFLAACVTKTEGTTR